MISDIFAAPSQKLPMDSIPGASSRSPQSTAVRRGSRVVSQSDLE
jgi:hypothetical protein